MLSSIATILVYVGFGFITEFGITVAGHRLQFPRRTTLGIVLLLASNLIWVTHFIFTGDYVAFLWQAGFVVINAKWLKTEKGESK